MLKRIHRFYQRQLLLQRASSIDKSSENPVFIVSAGRSGSTFLRKVLVSSDAINIPPESGNILVSSLNSFVQANSKAEKIEAVYNAFTESQDFKFWELSHNEIRQVLENSNSIILGDLIKQVFDCYANKYNFNSFRWGDKTPYLSFFIKELRLIYPNAKFIHLIRHPYDVINSRMQYFNESVEQATLRWTSSVKSISKEKHKGLFEVKYEDLVADKLKKFSEIFEFLDLGKFEPSFLEKEPHLGDGHLIHHKGLSGSKSLTRQVLTEQGKRYIQSRTLVWLKNFNYDT